MSNLNKKGPIRSLIKKFKSLKTILKKSASRVPVLIRNCRKNVAFAVKRVSNKSTRVSQVCTRDNTLQSSSEENETNTKKQIGLKNSVCTSGAKNELTNMSNPTVDIIEQNIQVPMDSHSNATEFIEPELIEQSAEIGDNHETYVISDLIENLKIDTMEMIQREKTLMNLIENEDILRKIQRDIQKELMFAKCNVYESTSISSEEDNINSSTTDCSISPNIISDSDKSSIVVNISSLNDPAPCDDSPSGEKMSNNNDRFTEINVHSELGGNSAAGDCRTPRESEQDVEKKPNLIVYKLPYCEPSTSREVVEHNARVMASMRLEAGMETGAAGYFPSDDTSDDYRDEFEYFESPPESDYDPEDYSWVEY